MLGVARPGYRLVGLTDLRPVFGLGTGVCLPLFVAGAIVADEMVPVANLLPKSPYDNGYTGNRYGRIVNPNDVGKTIQTHIPLYIEGNQRHYYCNLLVTDYRINGESKKTSDASSYSKGERGL